MTPRAAITIAAAAGFLAAALTTLILGIPTHQISDEWAYVLQADTFAHGRLTNPPHPMWRHFETYYVLQHPTYQAKYQPGQAAMLAIGEMFAFPIAGAWLMAALACGAVTWMLLAKLPVRWALAGGLVTALHPMMLTWSHSYWGGSLALAGGALVIGASLHDASALFGLGAVILANTRPFEGGLLVVALLLWRRPKKLLPALIVIAIGGAFNLYYNFRVTGSALALPYVEYERQYPGMPVFLFQKLEPSRSPNADMRVLARDVAYAYRKQHSVTGFPLTLAEKIVVFGNAAFQPFPESLLVRAPGPGTTMIIATMYLIVQYGLMIPFLFLGRAWRADRDLRTLTWLLLALFFVALAPVVLPLPHYGSPFAPLVLLLWLAAIREMPRWRTFSAIATIIGAIGVFVWFEESARLPFRWPEVKQRLDIARSLEQRAGDHLVLVRYTTAHQYHFSWIRNGPDIDRQRIVWARDRGDNAALLRYYATRDVWVVTAGDVEPQVQQIRAGSQAAPAAGPTS